MNPVGLTAGEFSVTCAGYLLIDTVKIGSNGAPGDFDRASDVDGAGFVAWQTNFPKPSDATPVGSDIEKMRALFQRIYPDMLQLDI